MSKAISYNQFKMAVESIEKAINSYQQTEGVTIRVCFHPKSIEVEQLSRWVRLSKKISLKESVNTQDPLALPKTVREISELDFDRYGSCFIYIMDDDGQYYCHFDEKGNLKVKGDCYNSYIDENGVIHDYSFLCSTRLKNAITDVALNMDRFLYMLNKNKSASTIAG